MNVPLADEAYDLLGQETKGHYLVGMTPKDFLDNFLPWNENTPDNYKQQAKDEAKQKSLKAVAPTPGQQELHMYEKFVKALDGWVTGTDNGQKLRLAHFEKPDADCVSMNVDISSYWESDFPYIPEYGSCNFALQQTHEEFKPDHTYDAFTHASDEGPNTKYPADKAPGKAAGNQPIPQAPNDTIAEASEETDDAGGDANDVIEAVEDATDATEEDAENAGEEANIVEGSNVPADLRAKVETATKRGIRTRGQIAAYAGVAMSMAFRTHFFSLLILGKFARIIRWDRRGAIVTSRFNYTKRPELVLEFYLRFGQLSLAQRGFDTRAVPLPSQTLPDNVAEAFDAYYQQSWHKGAKFTHNRGFTDDPQKPAKTLPFFRIAVEDPTAKVTETFYVPAPVFRHSCLTPFARASRRSLAYVADPTKEGKMCFLKDSWQEVSVRTAPEADIYRKLHAAGVPHIATMRLGGDVGGLETETQKWFDKLSHSKRYKRFGRMVCHRLVLDTVARDLSTFTWCKVLLSCLADVVDAAQQAYKAGVMHRDISAGNVMIVRDRETGEWRGVLIDWDMCLLLEKINAKDAIRTARTGTWTFISCRLLASTTSNPAVHSLGDDMESVFWVLAYEVLRYTKHDQGPQELFKLLQELFSDATERNGEFVGGKRKRLAIYSCAMGDIETAFARLESSDLDPILTVLGIALKRRYPDTRHIKLQIVGATADRVPSVNWDDPDDKWLSNFLREQANELHPLGVTPTALHSPTNDSKPPLNRDLWTNAKVGDHPADYYEMDWHKELDNSKRAQEKIFRGAKSSFLNHMDGIAYCSSKRPLDEEEEEDDGMQPGPAKKLKSTS